MRSRFPPSPVPGELLELSPHEVIRRYPESLRHFRHHAVDLRAQGAVPLRQVVQGLGEEGERFVRELERTLQWRSPGAP